MVKRFLIGAAGVLSPVAAFATDDVWSTATSAITTASTNIGTTLIAFVGIAAAFLGYKYVRRCMARG